MKSQSGRSLIPPRSLGVELSALLRSTLCVMMFDVKSILSSGLEIDKINRFHVVTEIKGDVCWMPGQALPGIMPTHTFGIANMYQECE